MGKITKYTKLLPAEGREDGNLGLGKRTIVKCNFRIVWEIMYWIQLVQNKNWWRNLLSKAMSIRVP
jgi:hypothetical protein